MFLSLPKRRIPHPKVALTLLVRDEADLIDLFVRYHGQRGIDALIVTDNGSKDGTREILQQHLRDGLISEIIDEPRHVYDQPRYVDRMIRRARDHYGADYCVNSDADEFWYTERGSLRDALAESRSARIFCRSRHMLPQQDGAFWETTDRCDRSADSEQFGIPRHFRFFDIVNSTDKVIHRTRGYRMIEYGNHNVRMNGGRGERSLAIWIYHYAVRSAEQFNRKILQGGAAVESTEGTAEAVGPRWRLLYRAHQAQAIDLNAEYQKVMVASMRQRLRDAGIVVCDTRMKDALAPVAHSPQILQPRSMTPERIAEL